MIFFGTGPGSLLALLIVAVVGSLVFFGPLAPIVLVFLAPFILIALLARLAPARRSRYQLGAPDWGYEQELEPPREFEEVRRAAQEDLLALAEDIRALDLDVEMPGANPEGKRDYAEALELYQRAAKAFDRARVPEDLEAVSSALEAGRFAMASAKARLEGRPPPERRPPCFFDPRHGPSVRDVHWAPHGGTPRAVPACAADAIRIEEGEEPLAREVVVGGQRRPYWDAPAYYGPWAGGFFGGFGAALLPTLFVGSMLGGGFGLGAPVVFDDGLDFGGEDFGGGDFGGGDFGGGDFGGGDFGGGD
jgi:hypothetical protein